ncbi:MAG: Flp pilus assembly complex ATPase component TadA, partial [Bacilli bacterium]|nr:Flp pilus assembly complex ATPase component TadA [Bacilli bacterium]
MLTTSFIEAVSIFYFHLLFSQPRITERLCDSWPGPTGCGKSTTLYSFIKEINDESVNIITVEDPVEYSIEGVNQVQINA